MGSRFVSPALGSWDQAYTVVTLASFLIVVAFGQGLVILLGGLDLSVASLITLSAVLSTTWIGGDNQGAVYLIPAILLICAAIGGVSGFGITFLGVPPFIMTMATGIIVASSALGYTSGTPRGASPTILVEPDEGCGVRGAASARLRHRAGRRGGACAKRARPSAGSSTRSGPAPAPPMWPACRSPA